MAEALTLLAEATAGTPITEAAVAINPGVPWVRLHINAGTLHVGIDVRFDGDPRTNLQEAVANLVETAKAEGWSP